MSDIIDPAALAAVDQRMAACSASLDAAVQAYREVRSECGEVCALAFVADSVFRLQDTIGDVALRDVLTTAITRLASS